MTTDIQIQRATSQDLEGVLALLAQHKLPLDGLSDHLGTTFVARRADRIVGSAALEMYADGALLRSVAVARDAQGQGVGHTLTEAAVNLARELHSAAVYLLTTTAEKYFPKVGFERIERDAVPDSVKTSIEFTSACPATAVVMRKLL